ncbi:HAD family phosphatase [Pseudoalteromonas sp. APAL1]|uniref:HAD family hydrolase n=1 Tax=unclassified Pseudoalteromonas TaxID=194690 RepID=UPI000EDB01EB|nr:MULTISPECIES: HAD family phosphatase [unclassified Pseudoalteromonas]MCF2919718.1 HAD family phosphatase [Pseudoalteromonas sp. APAL1]HCV01610.1 HAD family phosphatase [Pseudoalteromonas sp.]
MTLKAVLFDMDGTLVDSESVHFNIWNDLLAPFGVQYDETTFCQRFSGRPTLEAAKEVVTNYQLNISPEQLTDDKYAAFGRFVSTNLPTFMPHAKAVLEQVKASGLKMALVTGSAKDEAYPILKGYGIFDWFDCVVTKDDVNNPKPAGDPYQLALDTLNITANEAVAVEDTFTGVTAASNAGVAVYALPNHFTQEHDFSKAAGVFSDLHEFYKWLETKL